ncbi:hypothetical protein [Micromonospora echinofusca]|uniref:Hemerythrin HHE cation binding domain-containing protein n=1 Tax=Micromonospora echinofusca TaxID=47858 RepID=A0ABS3VY88_MICEH|nr:hypothetical protein [Micromonospora echinofusca]MBO4209512.1 hypothetical protein [Micromonospora echinofusca]
MDELDRLTEPGRDLLRRVDDLLSSAGAPEVHRIWPLLRRLRALPGEAFGAFTELRPEPLATAGHAVRQLIREYDDACAQLADPGDWSGAGASAFADVRSALVAHLDEGPESLVGRLESTGGYADALADWIDRSRLALARTLAEALGSAEAVTVVAVTGAGGDGSADGAGRAAGAAAAEIGARILATLSVAYDGAERLLREWGPSLAESAYRPPAPAPNRFGLTTRIGR